MAAAASPLGVSDNRKNAEIDPSQICFEKYCDKDRCLWLNNESNGKNLRFDEIGVSLAIEPDTISEEMFLKVKIHLYCQSAELPREYTPVTPFVVIDVVGNAESLGGPIKITLSSIVDEGDSVVLKCAGAKNLNKKKFCSTKKRFGIENGCFNIQVDRSDFDHKADGKDSLVICGAVRKWNGAIKNIKMLVAEKKGKANSLLMDICFLYDCPYLYWLVEEKYIKEGYGIKFTKVFPFGKDQKVGVPNFQAVRAGLTMRFESAYLPFISDEQLNYYKLAKEEGLDRLETLTDRWSFPPRYRMIFESKDDDDSAIKVDVTLDSNPYRVIIKESSVLCSLEWQNEGVLTWRKGVMHSNVLKQNEDPLDLTTSKET